MSTASANPIRQFSEGRSEIHKIHPRHLTPEPNFNERTDFGDIESLADSIMALGGVQQNLRIRKVKGENTLYIVDGERRYKACMLLIERGQDPGTVPCKLETNHTSDCDRLIHQVTLNSGKPFTLLEKARVYKRLKDEHGMKGVDIATSLQTTKQAVSNGLTIVTLGSPKLLKMIEAGQLAATTALEIIKLHKDNHAYQETKALDALSEVGRNHITPKDLKPPPSDTEGANADTEQAAGTDALDENVDNSEIEEDPDAPTTEEGSSDGESEEKIVTPTSEELGHDPKKPLDWSEHREGGGSGGGGGSVGGATGERNVNIEKVFERIDKMLEELNPDNVVPDRQTTLELVINTLNGTHNITPLKDHLLGRDDA